MKLGDRGENWEVEERKERQSKSLASYPFL